MEREAQPAATHQQEPHGLTERTGCVMLHASLLETRAQVHRFMRCTAQTSDSSNAYYFPDVHRHRRVFSFYFSGGPTSLGWGSRDNDGKMLSM